MCHSLRLRTEDVGYDTAARPRSLNCGGGGSSGGGSSGGISGGSSTETTGAAMESGVSAAGHSGGEEERDPLFHMLIKLQEAAGLPSPGDHSEPEEAATSKKPLANGFGDVSAE